MERVRFVGALLGLCLSACSGGGGEGRGDGPDQGDGDTGSQDGGFSPGTKDDGGLNGPGMDAATEVDDASTLPPLPVDDGGAPYFWMGQQAYIKASNTKTCGIHTYCDFGATVALSADGNTLAVGSPKESSPATGIDGDQNGAMNDLGLYAGAVYVFVREAGVWRQEAYVKASNTHPNDYFGSSVALSADGHTLVVGAPGEDSPGVGIGGTQDQSGGSGALVTESGAAYVFERGETGWAQSTYIKAAHPRSGSGFGSAVALSRDGDTLLVGAPTEGSAAKGVNGDQTDQSAGGSGAGYVFVRSGDGWGSQAYLKASNTGAEDHFGASLALSASGDVAVIGAPYESSNASGVGGDQSNNTMGRAGAAYTFSRNGGSWSPGSYLKSPTPIQYTYFGWSVALSADGTTVAASQPDNISAVLANRGAVHFFRSTAGIWSAGESVAAPNTSTSNFGWSIALSANGERLIVGDRGDKSSEKGFDGLGQDTTAPGAGALDAFTRTGSTWSWVHYVKPSNTYAGTLFGSSVAASNDALTVAVGARWELSSAEGINGPQGTSSTAYGAVYVFH